MGKDQPKGRGWSRGAEPGEGSLASNIAENLTHEVKFQTTILASLVAFQDKQGNIVYSGDWPSEGFQIIQDMSK